MIFGHVFRHLVLNVMHNKSMGTTTAYFLCFVRKGKYCSTFQLISSNANEKVDTVIEMVTHLFQGIIRAPPPLSNDWILVCFR